MLKIFKKGGSKSHDSFPRRYGLDI